MVIFILWDRIRTKSPEKTNLSHFETHPMSIWETPLKTTHECPIILTSQNHQCRSFPAICTLKNHAMFPIASKANWGSSAKSSLACRDSPPFFKSSWWFQPQNMSQIGSSPQVGVKIKNVWNQHLETWWCSSAMLVYWKAIVFTESFLGKWSSRPPATRPLHLNSAGTFVAATAHRIRKQKLLHHNKWPCRVLLCLWKPT